jgi:hypothetical protein
MPYAVQCTTRGAGCVRTRSLPLVSTTAVPGGALGKVSHCPTSRPNESLGADKGSLKILALVLPFGVIG